MAIPESQLTTWANQGAITTAKSTADSVKNALNSYSDWPSGVDFGNKSIKIKANNGRLPADVVVCSQYRRYQTVNSNDYVEGMTFWTKNDNRQVINYPKVHYDNGVSKHQNSNEWYKPVVRLFKNCRGNILGNITPSYFLECMLYNTPNAKFGTSYVDTFCNIVNWLNKNSLGNFVCQNGQLNLFGASQEQWDTSEAKTFIKNLISLWNNWR